MKWYEKVAGVWWRIVFWWKRQTGFLDLKEVVEATGTILWTDKDAGNPDGDVTFHLKLDPGQERLITAFGGRLTSADPEFPETLHCEVAPWTRDKFNLDVIKVGARVRVAGRWGFDGVHTGHNEFVDVLLALWRHQPNVIDGWFEIHPVEKLEALE